MSFLSAILTNILPLPLSEFVTRIFTWVCFWVVAGFIIYQFTFGDLSSALVNDVPDSPRYPLTEDSRLAVSPNWYVLSDVPLSIIYCYNDADCDGLRSMNDVLVVQVR